MKPNHLFRVVSLLVLASSALTAQVARQENVVPIKNWATPLYWQPNQAEREASGQATHQGAAPQLQFPGGTTCPGGTAGTGTGGDGCVVSTDALTFVAMTPCRLADTRGSAQGFNGMAPFNGYNGVNGAPIPTNATWNIPVQIPAEATSDTQPAPCGLIPTIAQAYSLNVSVQPATSGQVVPFVTIWPYGPGAKPYTNLINDFQGQTVNDAAIVPAGPGGSPYYGGVSVYNSVGSSPMNVWIDMNGYFAAPTDLNGNTAIGAGALASNTTGVDNTASGDQALQSNTAGSYNTASGTLALQKNNGNGNTASGFQALWANQTGNRNTASGEGALLNNTTGSDNTASGQDALAGNTTGSSNTATGVSSLQNNNGSNNTATGYQALLNNTADDSTAFGYQALLANGTGAGNTATGYQALAANTTGPYNTATGYQALAANTTGNENEASGYYALGSNTTGGANTAVGADALDHNTTGISNIAVGYAAAYLVSGGNSNNIHIGSPGATGDSGVIKIGTQMQTSTYIAGIHGATAPNGAAVYVDINGQLGTVLSSRRFKEQIADMGDTSNKLLQLRPVNFFYKPEYDDGSHLLQYGLIAEEVAKVYPEMVAYDNDGQILTVKYQLLAPMLLNEVQKQAGQNRQQAEQISSLEERLAALETLLSR